LFGYEIQNNNQECNHNIFTHETLLHLFQKDY
jgi:hypothetical protein